MWRVIPTETRVWGVLAAVVLATAFALTTVVVRTSSGVARPYLLELTGDASAQRFPQRVAVAPDGPNARLAAYVTADVRTLAISSLEASVAGLTRALVCGYRSPRSKTVVNVGEIRSRVLSFSQERVFDLSTVPDIAGAPGVRPLVICNVPGAVVFETYTTRVLELGWMATAAEPVVERSMGAQDLDFRVDIETSGAEDMRVTDLDSGTQVLATSLLVGPHHSDRYRVTWTSVAEVERRDIALIVIGALVAIGAAAVIEALRPALVRGARQ